MDIWWSGGLFVVLGFRPRVTADQRTTDGDSAFHLLGCEECFGLLFLWLRIPVMGAGNFFASSRVGWEPGIENDKVGAFDIWVFTTKLAWREVALLSPVFLRSLSERRTENVLEP